MALSDQELKILVKTVADNTGIKKARKAVSQLKSGVSKAGKALKVMGKTAAIAGAALTALAVGIAAKAIKEFAAFETRITDITTLMSGDATEAAAELTSGIQELMKTVPKTADDLGASAYAIVSAGITDTAEALNVLKESSQLAVAGLGSTEEATTLMTLALNNFKDSGLSAKETSDILFKTVKNGITTIGEMSQSFGLVAPLAVEAGVSLQELSAATAALTQVNKSASISQNSLKAALVSLGKPTKEAMDLFDALGVSTFKELIKNTGGMVAAFEALRIATDGDEQAFAKAIGSGEALSSVLALLGSQSEPFLEALDDMENGVNRVDGAFKKQTLTLENISQVLKNRVTVVFQKLGAFLRDELTPAVLIAKDAIKIWIRDNQPRIEQLKQAMMDLWNNALKPLITWFLANIPTFLDWAASIATVVIPVIEAFARGLLVALQAAKDLVGFLQNSKTVKALGTAFKVTTFVPRKLLGFDKGGVVPGPIGTPQMIMAHGGETVLPTHREPGIGTQNVTFNVTVRNDMDLSELMRKVDEHLGRRSIAAQFGASGVN